MITEWQDAELKALHLLICVIHSILLDIYLFINAAGMYDERFFSWSSQWKYKLA